MPKEDNREDARLSENKHRLTPEKKNAAQNPKIQPNLYQELLCTLERGLKGFVTKEDDGGGGCTTSAGDAATSVQGLDAARLVHRLADREEARGVLGGVSDSHRLHAGLDRVCGVQNEVVTNTSCFTVNTGSVLRRYPRVDLPTAPASI